MLIYFGQFIESVYMKAAGLSPQFQPIPNLLYVAAELRRP
jgi:hypothetical protein